MNNNYLRLGVNIDHVATIRNARGVIHPDPLKAAQIASQSGADGITAHLREDRRHISDEDIARLIDIDIPLNLEMAPTKEMLDIAVKHKPNACCLVPEKRQEVTTEGGLDLDKNFNLIKSCIEKLKENKIRVSLFIDPNENHIDKAKELNADIVEIHTGTFARTFSKNDSFQKEFKKIQSIANYASDIGLEVHAGHGLSYETTEIIAKISVLKELNIGHFIIGEAVFDGLDCVIKRMKAIINNARE
ncbi:MAG: pyridoxine 5'-phosphate synthase [Hyphomicrobiales bacterium]|nr:pyridoxine 5'-phosphate synthase [Hyphomicrobiales bacterium]